MVCEGVPGKRCLRESHWGSYSRVSVTGKCPGAVPQAANQQGYLPIALSSRRMRPCAAPTYRIGGDEPRLYAIQKSTEHHLWDNPSKSDVIPRFQVAPGNEEDGFLPACSIRKLTWQKQVRTLSVLTSDLRSVKDLAYHHPATDKSSRNRGGSNLLLWPPLPGCHGADDCFPGVAVDGADDTLGDFIVR